MLARMTENQRFAVLVLSCLGIGIALCAAVGIAINLLGMAGLNADVTATLAVALVLAALAASCWLFLKLVGVLFRNTYNG